MTLWQWILKWQRGSFVCYLDNISGYLTSRIRNLFSDEPNLS